MAFVSMTMTMTLTLPRGGYVTAAAHAAAATTASRLSLDVGARLA